ncbi:WD repeat-containing protein 82, partial [Trichinella britovi]
LVLFPYIGVFISSSSTFYRIIILFEMVEELRISVETLTSMVPARCHRDNDVRINSLQFSPDGFSLLVGSDDDTIRIYDASSGICNWRVRSDYGVDNVVFTHSDACCLHTSTTHDDSIRYLCLPHNKYIRFFNAHTKRVVGLNLSPVDDMFLSWGLDRTLFLWDLRIPDPVGCAHLSCRPLGSFDPEGIIFAIGINSEVVNLYDLRAYDKGPFNRFFFAKDTSCDWTHMDFSPDGRHILISTNGTVIRKIDSFSGMLLQTLEGRMNGRGIPIEAQFTPDGRYVFSGSSDGSICFWNSSDGEMVLSLEGSHSSVSQFTEFNPRYLMMASACTSLNLWIPSDAFNNPFHLSKIEDTPANV